MSRGTSKTFYIPQSSDWIAGSYTQDTGDTVQKSCDKGNIAMMTNELVEMIQNRIGFDGTMIRNALIFNLPGAFAAVILLRLGLKQVFKRYHVSKKSRHFIKTLGNIFILSFIIIRLFYTEGDRIVRLIQLRRDLKNETVSISAGVVDDMYSFEKGGEGSDNEWSNILHNARDW